ncbi:MAG TPA: GAF domain-containing protein, partial [Anaerolineales bacterium]|nr:GAF domain-containing protein [Anaerolineales bacterium]
MSTDTSPKIKRTRTGLAWKMMAILLPITLIPTLLMGILVYNRSRTLLIEQISERMETFITQSTDQINSWLLDKNLVIDRLARDDEFVQNIEIFNQLSAEDENYTQLRTALLLDLRSLNPTGADPLFNYFLLTDASGQVVISSNRAWEGTNLASHAYYQDKIMSGTRVTSLQNQPAPFHNPDDPATDIVLITSIQILDSNNTLIGYVIGISDSASIQGVVERNASFLPENNIFFYDETQKFSGITDLTTYDSFSPHTPTNGHLDLIFRGPDVTALAQSYNSLNGEEVLGIYTFFEPLNLGVIIETPESRSLQAIEALAPYALSWIAGTVIFIGILIYLSSRRISNPLNELANAAQSFAHGNWHIRANIKSNDEIGYLADTFNNMANDLSNLYREMEDQVEERTRQVITATEVSNLATNASNLDGLLDQTAGLIAERFNLAHTSIFLVDSAKETAMLRSATSGEGRNLIQQGFRVKISPQSIYRWVVENNQARQISLSQGDPNNLEFNAFDDAVEMAVVPIAIGSNVFGFIDVQSLEQGKVNASTLNILLTLANQLASAIQNFRLIEGTEVDLQQMNRLYQASHQIVEATKKEDIYSAIVYGIQQTSFFAAAYYPDDNQLHLIRSTGSKPYYEDQLPEVIPVSAKLTRMFFDKDFPPIIVKDLVKPVSSLRPEFFDAARSLNAQEAAFIPVMLNDEIAALILLASRDSGKISTTSIQPFIAFANLISTSFKNVENVRTTREQLRNNLMLNSFSNNIINESEPDKLYPLIHEQVQKILGDVDFFVALYDDNTKHIEIPYLFEGDQPLSIDPFPMGEGLTSIVIRTQQPLMLVENTEERARALGAKIVGSPARSWIGIPLIVSGNVIGVLSVQDVDVEKRFDERDLNILEALASPVAGAIQSSRIIAESQRRAYQLETSAEIAQEASTTLDQDELLKHALKLIRERFNFYHASIFLIDTFGEYAVIQESTGEAGRKMISEGHRLKIGSQSVIGYVTANRSPLVVNDVTKDPTHRFNPLLPDTRAELGLPIMLGDKLLGAIDVQSTTPYSFSSDDIEVLQILANQLAVAIENANLFTETQEHLAQHRLIHHVTTVSASSKSIEDALSSAVQGLRVTLGDHVSILLLDANKRMLRVSASSGYEQDLVGMQIEVGEGVTG